MKALRRLALGVLLLGGASFAPAAEPLGVRAERAREEADALASAGRWPEVLPAAQRLLTLRQSHRGREDLEVAEAWHFLGVAAEKLEQWTLAEEGYAEAARQREKLGGPQSPALADSLHNLGWLYGRRGRVVEAMNLLQRVIRIREATGGAGSPATAWSQRNFARVLLLQGWHAEGERLLAQALATLRARADATAEQVEQCAADLQEVRRTLGLHKERAGLCAEMARAEERTNGPSLAAGQWWWRTATAWLDAGDGLAAQSAAEAAMNAITKAAGPEAPALAEPLLALGRALAGRGRPLEALASFTQASSLLPPGSQVPPRLPSDIQRWRAVCLVQLARDSEADAALREAITWAELDGSVEACWWPWHDLEALHARAGSPEMRTAALERLAGLEATRSGAVAPLTLAQIARWSVAREALGR